MLSSIAYLIMVVRSSHSKRPLYRFFLVTVVFMAALRSRRAHYIFIQWFLLLLFLSFFFSSPNLSRRRLDVYHTSTHGVALVRI